MDQILIRTIQPRDNPFIASIIRESLSEFGANKQGTVFFDQSTDHLFEVFQIERTVYFIAEQNLEVVGGAGIFPSAGLPTDVCELVKMYLKKHVRGMGLGRKLVNQCLGFATNAGYTHVYLETMPELKKAVSMYEHLGFEYLPGPMGNTGHFGCDVWMIKKL